MMDFPSADRPAEVSSATRDVADGPTDTGDMFAIQARDGGEQVVIIGKPTRKRATTVLNIPISQALRQQLQSQVVGSMAMGTSALLEWALGELARQHISIQARANDERDTCR